MMPLRKTNDEYLIFPHGFVLLFSYHFSTLRKLFHPKFVKFNELPSGTILFKLSCLKINSLRSQVLKTSLIWNKLKK